MDSDEQKESSVEPKCNHTVGYHTFQPSQLPVFRARLLQWYDNHRRMLPWRGDAPAAVAAGSESSTDANAAFGAREKKAKAAAKAKVAEGARSIASFFSKQTNERTAAAAASSVFPVAAAAATPAVASSSSPAAAVPSSETTPATAAAATAATGARVPVSAYGVWVSEIMLQQTRVETVIDFYTRWMRRFPRVEDLAAASLEEVNSHWAGLGFYRRAKFLHLGAQEVVSKHGGVLPGTLEGLKGIKGVGPYTAAAIGSIAMGLRVPLVDGNVVRVYSRLRALRVDPKSKTTDTAMWAMAGQVLGEEEPRPGDFNQALMELGATVCTPLNPQCVACPVSQLCHARNEVLQKKRPCDPPLVQTSDAAAAAADSSTSSAAAATSSSAMEVIDIESLELPSTGSLAAAASSSSSSSSAAKPKAKSRSKSAAADPFANPLSPCTLCIPADDGSDPPPTAVTCYPTKASKKPPLEQHVAVCVVKRPFISAAATDDNGEEMKDGGGGGGGEAGRGEGLYLIIRRPSEGLLANQWELPSVIVEATASSSDRTEAIANLLSTQLCLAPETIATLLTHTDPTPLLGEVVHLFSHRKHIMRITTATLTLQPGDDSKTNDSIAAAARDRVVTIEDTEQKDKSSGKKRPVASSGSASKKNNGKRTKREEAASAAAAEDDDSAVEDEDGEEEENDEDDTAATSSSSAASTALRSYRWVPLSLLQQDHKHSSGSELGLSSAQRKVVQLITKGSGGGDGAATTKRKSTAAVSKKKSAPADKPASGSKKKTPRAPKRATPATLTAAAASTPRCVIELESDSE